MAKRKDSKSDELLVDIVEVKEGAQDFMDDNQNYIFGGLVILVLIFGGWFAYKNFYKAPRQAEAVEQMYKAQEQFERDSFKLALTDPGSGFPGFLDIIDSYSGTNAANSAKYYTGISYLRLGQYEAAIEYLKEFKASDEVLPIMKYGVIGDAYAEISDLDQAMTYYEKAVNAGENDALVAYYLLKVGMLNEKNGDTSGAIAAYERIRDDFPNSKEALDIEKYLYRVKN